MITSRPHSMMLTSVQCCSSTLEWFWSSVLLSLVPRPLPLWTRLSAIVQQNFIRWLLSKQASASRKGAAWTYLSWIARHVFTFLHSCASLAQSIIVHVHPFSKHSSDFISMYTYEYWHLISGEIPSAGVVTRSEGGIGGEGFLVSKSLIYIWGECNKSD